MIEKVKKEFCILFKELPFMLGEVNKNLKMTRDREENLISNITNCDNYEVIKWKYFYPFVSYKGEKLEYKFDSFLANAIYNFRYTSADNEVKSIFLDVLSIYNKMDEYGEESYNLNDILNDYNIKLKKRKTGLKKKGIGLTLLTILLFSLISLNPSSIIMLLAKLYLIGYNSLALILGLSEFRFSSFKGIDEKNRMLVEKIDELHLDRVVEELEQEKLEVLYPEDLSNGKSLYPFNGKCSVRGTENEQRALKRTLIKREEE